MRSCSVSSDSSVKALNKKSMSLHLGVPLVQVARRRTAFWRATAPLCYMKHYASAGARQG